MGKFSENIIYNSLVIELQIINECIYSKLIHYFKGYLLCFNYYCWEIHFYLILLLFIFNM